MRANAYCPPEHSVLFALKSEITDRYDPTPTFLKRALDAKLETGKTQNFTPRVGTANSITWWISISSSQVHEKCMKTEFSPELERVWFRSFRVCSACI